MPTARANPFLIVYLDENLTVRVNRMIWKGDVTPFIYGVQNVWAFLLLEKPVNLEARLTTLWIEEQPVTQGLRNMFVSPGRRLTEEREARAVTKPITLTTLTGDEGVPDDLWIGVERFYVEENAAYEITISPADETARKKLDFLRIYSRFTNSEQKSVDFGLGVGYTFNISEQILDDLDGIRTDSGVISGSWLFSIYLRRPILVEPIQSRTGSRYRVSYAVTFGANFNIFDLDQFIVGLNIGHLFGRHGLLVGASFIDPLDSTSKENDTGPYFAYVYNF